MHLSINLFLFAWNNKQLEGLINLTHVFDFS